MPSQMHADAIEAIEEIAADLGLRTGRVDLDRLLYLCERHGSAIPEWVKLPRGVMGSCDPDGVIRIDPAQVRGSMAQVIAHELAHRLCTSPRYEGLNAAQMLTYDRAAFWEVIAAGVEWLFRRLQSAMCEGARCLAPA